MPCGSQEYAGNQKPAVHEINLPFW
jgi:hypothetical protein